MDWFLCSLNWNNWMFRSSVIKTYTTELSSYWKYPERNQECWLGANFHLSICCRRKIIWKWLFKCTLSVRIIWNCTAYPVSSVYWFNIPPNYVIFVTLLLILTSSPRELGLRSASLPGCCDVTALFDLGCVDPAGRNLVLAGVQLDCEASWAPSTSDTIHRGNRSHTQHYVSFNNKNKPIYFIIVYGYRYSKGELNWVQQPA